MVPTTHDRVVMDQQEKQGTERPRNGKQQTRDRSIHKRDTEMKENFISLSPILLLSSSQILKGLS